MMIVNAYNINEVVIVTIRAGFRLFDSLLLHMSRLYNLWGRSMLNVPLASRFEHATMQR